MAADEPFAPGTGATVAAALVTGAGKRIGRAIALSLGKQGWKVAVHYHGSRSAAEEVVEEIRSGGGEAVSLRADLAKEPEVLRLLPEAERALGPVTLLVNNASVFEMDKIETVTRESWDRHIETGLRAPLVLIQELSRRLPPGSQGNVINMLDERVWALTPYFLSYTLAKAGLWTLTRTLALGLAPRIRVNGIGPGPTLPSPRQTDEQFREQWRRMPLGRGTTPEEIARAVEFILSAPAMTGQMIALDGGQHLGWAVPQPRRIEPDE
jgi:NAD(P)-dependent dehydrogenase (short-subunit alcohol dehydrogenase family)